MKHITLELLLDADPISTAPTGEVVNREDQPRAADAPACGDPIRQVAGLFKARAVSSRGPIAIKSSSPIVDARFPSAQRLAVPLIAPQVSVELRAGAGAMLH